MNIIRYGGPMSRTRKVGSPIGYSGSAAVGLTGFVSVWATTAINETITIPCQNVGTFNAVIDWGDGTIETITTYNGFSHQYAAIDDHTISITGTFPNIRVANATDGLKLKKVLNLGTVGWTNFNSAFYGCANLTEVTAGSTDTSAVASLYQAFQGCTSLTSVNLVGFNTSNVDAMLNTFQGCNALTSMAGVEDFDITGLSNAAYLNNFLTGGKMTTAQYDALLVKWRAQDPFNGMTPSFGASTYTGGSAAATARQDLIDIDGWAISDGGIAP